MLRATSLALVNCLQAYVCRHDYVLSTIYVWPTPRITMVLPLTIVLPLAHQSLSGDERDCEEDFVSPQPESDVKGDPAESCR